MNEYTIIRNMRDAVNNDADIAAWCQATFEGGPFLFIGVDPENPPGQELYPLVAFYPMSRATGAARDDADTGIMVEIGVADQDTLEQEPGNENLVEYAGIYEVIEFRRLVLSAIAAADFDGGFISEIESDYDPVLEFPLFSTLNVITVTRPYQFRDDRIT